jgi:nitrate reductase (cytochrome), electron transfer subunit
VNATEPRITQLAAPSQRRARFVSLLVVFVLGAALVGFLRGIEEPPALTRPARTEPAAATARPAPGYAQLMNGQSVPHAAVGAFDPVVRTEQMKLTALADRAKNRAFDTAPPTIPHPTDGMSTVASCLACHGSGLRVGEKVATKGSHPHYANCVQCHAPDAPPELARFATSEPDNGFVGAYRSGPGSRASPGAPPTIPHTTWMRQDCTSCHGLVARPGIRTTHPWLTNCTQCHAPSAALDQVTFPLPANGGTP